MECDFHPNSLITESQKHPTPAFWFSAKRIKENYHRFVKGLPGAKIFFPLKVNAYEPILKLLREEEANFDAASLGEIKILKKIGVPAEKIIFTTPVKPTSEIKAAHKMGVIVFVVDSLMEIDKIAHVAPSAKILLRIQTSNKGSQWPLSRRFGVDAKHAVNMLQFVVDHKLTPLGLAFHVGSQCLNTNNWRDAIRRSAKIFNDFEKRNGYELKVLDVGGGFPVCYTKSVPSLEEIFHLIRYEVEKGFKNKQIELWLEPGRAIVADTAFAVTTVIGRTKRGHNHWLFCDLGAFNGLLELIEPSSRGFRYDLYAPVIKNNRKGNGANGAKQRTFILTGPSCDGDDILFEKAELPDLSIGDRIYFLKTGAYSIVYSSFFCGNRKPRVYLV